MVFAQPYYFLLLLLVPIIVALYLYRRRQPSTFTLSTLQGLQGAHRSLRVRLHMLPWLLLIASFVLMVIALARPQNKYIATQSTTEGIHIVMAMDISTSMLAEDLKPNRFEAAKSVAADFIESRPQDNIGLVAFAGESFTQCPLTSDHTTLLNLLINMETGIIQDGTAIGNGIATAVSRLKDLPAKSKVIILLTDGSNNSGEIAPLTAAEIASTFGIRIYTIGVGSQGTAPYPFQTPFGIQYQDVPVDIDEESLTQIAANTDGRYFRATDNEALRAIYQEIDQLEKAKITVENYSQPQELFWSFLVAAFLCLLLAYLLRTTWLRTLP